ncbi:MAG: DNA polymerase-1, partial [bacterium]
MAAKKKLVVIDGFNFLFRAYYAVRALNRSDGMPTNALYGFTQMLLKVIDDLQPEYLAVALDVPRNFRHDLYSEYKAHRKEVDEEMKIQIPMLEPLVQAFGIVTLKVDGFEADDIIATLAHKYNEETEVVIVSSDKDLMQLVNDDVSMFDTMKDLHIKAEQVFDKFSVTPDKVIEVQSLIGDASDNIPGVKSIGPKTASKLIDQFGSLENLYANIDQVEREKLKQSLLENKDNAFLSKKLVTLSHEVPLSQSLESLVYSPNAASAEVFLDDMEFNRLKARAAKLFGKAKVGQNDTTVIKPKAISPAEEPIKVTVQYETVDSDALLDKWLNLLEKHKIFAIDTETTSLDFMQAKLVGISLSVQENEACYIPLDHTGDTLFGDIKQLNKAHVLAKLKPFLADSAYTKIGQNIKYDMHIFKGEGLDVHGIEDTMVMSACLDAGLHGHGMDALAKLHLDHHCIPFKEVAGVGKKQVTFDKVAVKEATQYAAEDADITLRLYHVLKKRIDMVENAPIKNLYETIERPLIPVLMGMEQRGVLVDRNHLEKLSFEFEGRLKTHEAKIYALAGEEFNINSPKQLGEILFDKMGLEQKSKKRSTKADILEKLAEENEICAEVVKYRGLAKLRSTYTEALIGQINPKTGRVHTSYHQIGAATGRFSSSDPNLQNIPARSQDGRKIRQTFIAKDGYVLMCADYSQIELRLLAHLSGSEALQTAFVEDKDIHAVTAHQIFNVPLEEVTSNQRSAAKAINFGLVYGMGKTSLAKHIGVTQAEAASYIESYFEHYSGVRTFLDGYKQKAHEYGYIETLYGRRVHFPNINEKHPMLRAGA